MNTIINYVEIMFKDFPQNADVLRLKQDMLDAMEDKYNELIQEGMSENEAIGTVITQFGNMDEIRDALGFQNNKVKDIDEDIQYVSSEEVHAYLRFKRHFACMIALGVVLCILSVTPAIILTDDLTQSYFHINSIYADAFSALCLFTINAISVFIFIYYGSKNANYKNFEKTKMLIHPHEVHVLISKYNDIKVRHSLCIACGVVSCILGIAFTATLTEIWDYDIFGIILYIFSAIGVFLFIYSGVVYSAYTLLIDNKKTRDHRIHEDQNEKYYGITMSIATIIFLISGIVFGLWHPAWLIFPITAILTSLYLNIIHVKD